MAKTKKGQESLINRNTYESIKKMDRLEIENFLRAFYQKGYAKGQADTISELRLSDQFTQMKPALLAVLKAVRGVGSAAMSKIEAAFDEMEHWSNEGWSRRGDGE